MANTSRTHSKNNTVVEVLGIPFQNIGFDECVQILSRKIKNNDKTFVVTANPEIVMYASKFPDYKEQILKANYIVPDGSGIILGSKILGIPIKERVTGFDLTIRLLELSHKNGWKVFLLGGTEEINFKAGEHIQSTYPGLKLVGRQNGFFDWNDNRIRTDIQENEPDLILVAMGFPKQEQWITDHLDCFRKGIFIGVGGSIDVLAGAVKRAPLFWRKLYLEWFYRLIKQPSRWRRMLVLPLFVKEILIKKIVTSWRNS